MYIRDVINPLKSRYEYAGGFVRVRDVMGAPDVSVRVRRCQEIEHQKARTEILLYLGSSCQAGNSRRARFRNEIFAKVVRHALLFEKVTALHEHKPLKLIFSDRPAQIT